MRQSLQGFPLSGFILPFSNINKNVSWPYLLKVKALFPSRSFFVSKWLRAGHGDANGSLLWQFLGAFSRSDLEYVYLLYCWRLPASRNLEVTLDGEDAGHTRGSGPEDFMEKSLHSSPESQTSRLLWGAEGEGRKKKHLRNFPFLLGETNPN